MAEERPSSVEPPPKRARCEPADAPADAPQMTARERKEAERKAERERKEDERKAEKERKEAERKAEKERKEAERKAEKERKEAERKAEKERKEAERKAEKERKEAERKAEKERKEAERKAEKERKEAMQPKINLFFKTGAQAPSHQSRQSSQQADVTPQSSSGNSNDAPLTPEEAYRKYILPYQPKLGGTLYSPVCNVAVTDAEMDPLEFLQNQHNAPLKMQISYSEFAQRLALTRDGNEAAVLAEKVRLVRLQFSHLNVKYASDPFHSNVNAEFRPPFIGTSQDLSPTNIRLLAADPTRTDVDTGFVYDYDSEAEWDENGEDDESGEDVDDDDEVEPDEVDGESGEEMRGFCDSDDDNQQNVVRIVGPITPVALWGHSGELSQFNIIPQVEQIDPFAVPAVKAEEPPSEADAPVAVGFASRLEPLTSKVDLAEFRQALMQYVNGTSTKLLIVEVLKEKFPTAAKEVRQAFDLCMERAGKKRNERHWVLTKDFDELTSGM